MSELSCALSDGQTALVELNDLKRITSASRQGSIATRLFGEAWSALVAGSKPDEVTWSISGRALAAARLGDLDADVLSNAGLAKSEIAAILRDAVEAVVPPFAASLRSQLTAGATASLPAGPALGFVAQLGRQPRAGITCPGKPRILLEPPENHADHCLMVAVYGVLLAPRYHADPVRVFLASLSHHFHNAGMPDAGFTGEVLLGRHLETVVSFYTRECLAALAPRLRHAVEDARAILPDADTPDGRAFHAADVLDRVLQSVQYTRAGSLTASQMLGEMEFVHAGPVKAFQDDVLRQAGLL